MWGNWWGDGVNAKEKLFRDLSEQPFLHSLTTVGKPARLSMFQIIPTESKCIGLLFNIILQIRTKQLCRPPSGDELHRSVSGSIFIHVIITFFFSVAKGCMHLHWGWPSDGAWLHHNPSPLSPHPIRTWVTHTTV